MKTLTENELEVVNGGEVQPLNGPVAPYSPPAPRWPFDWYGSGEKDGLPRNVSN